MTQHFYEDVSNLNAPYDIVPLQGLGQVSDDPKYPWRTASQDTLILQQDLNEWLTADKGCLLLEDGVLGPRTCGAIQKYGGFSIATCQNHSAEEPPIMPEIPCKSNSKPDVALPGTAPLPVVTASVAPGGIPGWMIGVGLGALAIGAALYLGKKKKKR